jgi:dynein heavy chain, axonemal
LFLQSVIAKALLQSVADKSNYVPVFINFSAQTSSSRTQEMIEGKLEKKRKNILGNFLLNNALTINFTAQE